MNQWQAEDDLFIEKLRIELAKARAKFPSANMSTLALMEEVGELAQAKLKVKAGKWPLSRILEEAVQVAAMAMRAAIEPDASIDMIKYVEPSE